VVSALWETPTVSIAWADECSSTVRSSGRDALSNLQVAEVVMLGLVQVLDLVYELAELFGHSAGTGSG
jgi:hypothetical protein